MLPPGAVFGCATLSLLVLLIRSATYKRTRSRRIHNLYQAHVIPNRPTERTSEWQPLFRLILFRLISCVQDNSVTGPVEPGPLVRPSVES